MARVCVYAASTPGAREEYAQAAVALAAALAERGLGVVYGGGHVGLMGALADAALERGVEVIGVIPQGLVRREVGHTNLSELVVVETMHERKLKMAELADQFVALPGGYGTLEELFETLTWTQLGIHLKPTGLLNVAGYWTPLEALLDHMVSEGTVRADNRALLLSDPDPEQLLDRLAAWTPPPHLAAWA